MIDIVSKAARSRMMSNIKGKNTAPEILIRCGLHRRGFRYRLHEKKLPGKPDLVFPKYKAVIQVHGCFWHKHDCHLFKWPSTRKRFWKEKICSNARRDTRNFMKLNQLGWRTLIVWECALKGRYRYTEVEVIDRIALWLYSDQSSFEIACSSAGLK
ncbi:MAG: very short patch repair endonuclease [Gammaproteobacteria bacterium]|nr:very short patch repair endonuclease [Gammaproteobacteria bacterium]